MHFYFPILVVAGDIYKGFLLPPIQIICYADPGLPTVQKLNVSQRERFFFFRLHFEGRESYPKT